MISFETRIPGTDLPITKGQFNHIPREGEFLIIQNIAFAVDKVIWEFGPQFEHGGLVILMLKTPTNANLITREL